MNNTNKRATKITDSLNALNKEDIYSLMLFTLYKMKDIPDYLTLTQLCYILDGDNLNKFLSYYGGMTIRVPTQHEFQLVLRALSLYQYVNLDKGDFESGLKDIVAEDYNVDEVKAMYAKIIEVLTDYEFSVQQ